jgi:hypothetical protein
MSNLQRRPKTGVYRLRRAVPKNIRQPVATLLGRTAPMRELVRSLRTRDPREAKQLMTLIAAARDGCRRS